VDKAVVGEGGESEMTKILASALRDCGGIREKKVWATHSSASDLEPYWETEAPTAGNPDF
jgi:hypothetical protein